MCARACVHVPRACTCVRASVTPGEGGVELCTWTKEPEELVGLVSWSLSSSSHVVCCIVVVPFITFSFQRLHF